MDSITFVPFIVMHMISDFFWFIFLLDWASLKYADWQFVGFWGNVKHSLVESRIYVVIEDL